MKGFEEASPWGLRSSTGLMGLHSVAQGLVGGKVSRGATAQVTVS